MNEMADGPYLLLPNYVFIEIVDVDLWSSVAAAD